MKGTTNTQTDCYLYRCPRRLPKTGKCQLGWELRANRFCPMTRRHPERRSLTTKKLEAHDQEVGVVELLNF